jgi:hypothetical protein
MSKSFTDDSTIKRQAHDRKYITRPNGSLRRTP